MEKEYDFSKGKKKPYMYALKDFGSFYIGGRDIEVDHQQIKLVKRNKDFTVEVDPNGCYTIEAMYVQYFLPENYKEICILIHGGSHTGAVWENTPDGRKGWLHLLLENNVGVYIVDSVERGRSGWCSIPGIWEGEPELITKQMIWTAFRFGQTYGVPHENLQFPVNNFSEFVKYNVPRWNCNAPASVAALGQLIKKTGPCTLIAHSQGADMAMQCLNLVPTLIKNVVLLEPAAFPTITSKTCSAHLKVLTLFGDYVSSSTLWAPVKKQAMTYHNDLLKAGIDAQFIALPEIGIHGNSHMMMMEKNNVQIFQFICGVCKYLYKC